MPASDVPGYLQGFRFNAANLADGAFADLSGFGAPCVTRTGTPTVQTVGGHEGLLLDNTWHGEFWHPNSWHGTALVVARLQRVAGGTYTKFPVIYANDGAGGTAGRMCFTFNSTLRSVFAVGTGGVNTTLANLTDSTIGVAAHAMDQSRRRGYATRDAVTVTQSAEYATAVNGSGLSMGSNRDGAIIGALTGNSANTTPETQAIMHLYEVHYFRANAILDQQAALAAFMAELSAAYS